MMGKSDGNLLKVLDERPNGLSFDPDQIQFKNLQELCCMPKDQKLGIGLGFFSMKTFLCVPF